MGTWPLETKAILEALTPSKEYLFTDPLCWAPQLLPQTPPQWAKVGSIGETIVKLSKQVK